jgi:mortality factor 4-like protein 1
VLKYNDANIAKQQDLINAQNAEKAKNRKSRKAGGKELGEPGSPAPSDASIPTTGAKTKSKALSDLVEASKQSVKDSGKDGGPAKKKVKVEANVETEDEFLSKVEVKIKVPDEVKSWLVDDWDLVTRQKKLVDLPVKSNNVDSILDQYLAQKKGANKATLREIILGIKEYFNSMIGCQLLYKFERPQYEKILKSEAEGKPMSEVYGAVHLMRLFTKIGQMLIYTEIDEKDMSSLVVHLNDCLRFMSKSNMFSTTDYVTAPPEYHRKTL